MEKKEIKLENLMTVKDYAKSMSVSIPTVYNWLKWGRISKVEFMGVEFIDKTTFDYSKTPMKGAGQ